MKKLLILFICLSMFISSLPASAENEAAALFNETFCDTVTNAVPNSATLFGDGCLVQVAENGKDNKMLCMKNKWETSIVQFNFTLGDNDEFIIENKVMVEDNYSDKDLLQYANGSARFTLAKRKKDGGIYDMSGQRVGDMPVGKWVTLSAAMNLITLRYELYINGRLVTHRGILKDPGDLTKVGFTSEANPNDETTFYCDYFRVYKGEKLIDNSRFAKAVYNPKEKKTNVQHASPAKYKPSLIFELDCESQSPGQGVVGMPIYSGAAGITREADGSNQFFRMTYKKGVSPLVGALLTRETYPCCVFQQDVRIDRKNNLTSSFRVNDSAAGGHSIVAFSILPNGKLQSADNKIITDKTCQEEWVNIAAVFDFRTKDIDYYIDGEIVAENVPFPSTDADISSNLWEVRWGMTTGGTGEHYFDIDNCFIYKGLVPVDKDTLFGGGAVMETEEKLDYTIDTSPIDPDMSAFRRVSDEISKQSNPSSYLTDYSNTKQVYKDTICVVAENSNIWIKDGKYNSDYKFKWDGLHFIAPVPTLAAFVKKNYSYDENTKTVKIGNVEATVGNKFITVNGVKYESESSVQIIDGICYIPLREFVRYGMNKFFGESSKGFAVIANEEKEYSFPRNPGAGALLYSVDDYSHMMAYLILDRLNADSLKELYKEKAATKSFPRMNTMKKDAPRYYEATKTDPKMKEFSDLVLRDAKNQLNVKLNIKDVPGVQINGLPSTSLPEQMYYAYYVTGDRAYIDKVLEHAKFLVNLENWNGDAHMLSTSWICLYLAYTYDLFYDELTQTERDDIVYACINKAIKYHQRYMYGVDWNNWPIMDYNWNVICNTGPMLASLIFMGQGYDDALFLDTIEKGQVSLGYFMHYFAPDGGGWETLGYTNYILSYLNLLLDGIQEYFGDDLGLSDYPGYDNIGEFFVNCTGKASAMAIHDDNSTAPPSSALGMYYSKKTKNYEQQRRNVDALYKNLPQYNIQGIVMMKNYMPNPPETEYTTVLDSVFRGMEISGSRDSWGEDQQTFLSIHAGYNNAAHGQYDMGNFFFEANGEIFATDIGRELYELQGSKYADRTEGHNLWVVNPDETPGQNTIANSQIKMIESKPKGVIFSVDLNPAYYGLVEDAKRGYMLSGDRKVFTVQDEIKPFEGNNEFYWFWNTPANITIDEENNMVWLENNGKLCAVYFDSNVEFQISKQDKLEPLPSSPKIANQLLQPLHLTTKKVVINFFSEGEPIKFRAVAVPYGQKWERTEVVPMSEWKIPDGSTTEGYDMADKIYLDSKELPGFKPNVYDYKLYYPEYKGMPDIIVETKGKVSEIIPITEDKRTVVIRIESSTVPGNFKTYTITLESMYCEGVPKNAQELTVVDAFASANDGNVPKNVFDGDLSTRWSSAGEQWITIDLGDVKEVNALGIKVYNDDGRRLSHRIYVSTDNETYKPITKDLFTTGVINCWEYTEFAKVKARYIKLMCNGSVIVPYNSITELKPYLIP